MVKTSRGRRLMAARTALEGLQRDVEYALKALGNGHDPGIDLHSGAVRAERALAELSAIDEVLVFYNRPDESAT